MAGITVSRRVLRLLAVCCVVAAAAVVAAAVALASSSKVWAIGVSHAASAGVTVWAGPPQVLPPPRGVSKQADALAFFPESVTVTAGQPVTFQFSGFHTVTFTGGQTPPPVIAPSKNLKQPLLKDAAGQPMWWSGGQVPLLTLNPAAVPQVGGATIASPSQVRSSGVLRVLQAPPNRPPKPYTLTFLKPGVYRFFCLVHPGMHGVINVLPSTATPPTAEQTAAALKTQAGKVIADLRRIQSQNPTEKLTVWVGAGTQSGAEVASMFPRRLVVKTGDVVKFVNHDTTDIHTVTFGPVGYTGQIEKTFISPKGIANPFGVLSSEPPGATPPPPEALVYDGANHGNGYLNAGVLSPYSSNQTPHLVRIKFTRPGIYHFECVIHQNMDGTIIVH